MANKGHVTAGRPADPGQLSGWRMRLALWSGFAAAAGYLGFVLWSGWRDVAGATVRVGMLGIAAALALSLVNYGLRFVRWQVYLRAMGHQVDHWSSLKIYLAGFALTATPGKAGEALRAVLLKERGIPYSQSLGAFLSERLSDLLAVLVLSLFGLTAYPTMRPLIAMGLAGAWAAMLLLSRRGFLEAYAGRIGSGGRIRSLAQSVFRILLQTTRCHRLPQLAVATLLSVTAWAAEAWAFHLLLQWIGIDVTVQFAFFVYAVSMLAGAASFMPGGLGSAEAVMIALLLSTGADHADAVTATLLCRLTTLWFAVAIGCIALGHRLSPSKAA